VIVASSALVVFLAEAVSESFAVSVAAVPPKSAVPVYDVCLSSGHPVGCY